MIKQFFLSLLASTLLFTNEYANNSYNALSISTIDSSPVLSAQAKALAHAQILLNTSHIEVERLPNRSYCDCSVLSAHYGNNVIESNDCISRLYAKHWQTSTIEYQDETNKTQKKFTFNEKTSKKLYDAIASLKKTQSQATDSSIILGLPSLSSEQIDASTLFDPATKNQLKALLVVQNGKDRMHKSEECSQLLNIKKLYK